MSLSEMIMPEFEQEILEKHAALTRQSQLAGGAAMGDPRTNTKRHEVQVLIGIVSSEFVDRFFCYDP